MSAKHIVVLVLAVAVVLVAPFAMSRESHLLVDVPPMDQQG